MRKAMAIGACAALFLIAGCKPAVEKEPTAAMEPPPAMTEPVEAAPTVEAEPETQHAAVHWGYTGDEAPEHWAELSPEFSACGEGRRQSPIDLTGAVSGQGDRVAREFGKTFLSIEARERVLDVVDNGHTIQIGSNAEMSLRVGDKAYELVQYHFHAPSEHTIDGKHSPLEAHFVHESADGELAVASVLFEEGGSSPFLEGIVANLPSGPDDPRHIEAPPLTEEILSALPEGYYRYEGSLTTPPCTENVHWFVSRDYYSASPEQISALSSLLHDNNRPVQPLNDRVLAVVDIEE